MKLHVVDDHLAALTTMLLLSVSDEKLRYILD